MKRRAPLCASMLAIVATLTAAPVAYADGATFRARVTHAAYDTPEGAPDVLVHVPDGFVSGAPFDVVVFLHGYASCIESYLPEAPVPCRARERPRPAFGLAAAHDASRTQSLLVVPQLAWLTRSGSPGRFAQPHEFASFLSEALAAVPPSVARPSDARRIVLVAHSAGYETALALLRLDALGDTLHAVVLLDALYAGTRTFSAWASTHMDRSIVSLHTAQPATTAQNELLVRALQRSMRSSELVVDPPDLERAVATHRVVVARTPARHGDVPRRHLAPILRGLLGAGPAASPLSGARLPGR